MESDPTAKIFEQAKTSMEPNPATQFMQEGFV